jgi:single-stranded DNA-binding protein
MAFEQKELSGALFKNKKKTMPNHPEYRGSCKVNGVEYWISSWINTPKGNPNGEKYMTLNFQEKDEAAKPVNQSAAKPNNFGNFDNLDDDIPF